MKILIFGKTGQVARELQRQTGLGIELTALARDQADLSHPAACADAVLAHDCDAVINAAAYTAVDKAETEEGLATLINGGAPGEMARAAAKKGVPLLHISTDYVFDGSGTAPWTPEAPTAPLGAYGRSKLVGEIGVRGAGGAHAILRTSWVFSAHGTNFVKAMLRLAETHDRLTVVADQIGGPTAAADIAAALLTMAAAFHRGDGTTGTYHFAGRPDVSWADFAREVLAQAKRPVEVSDIPAADYSTVAPRPANSRLCCTSLKAVFDIDRPDWQIGLKNVLEEILDTEK